MIDNDEKISQYLTSMFSIITNFVDDSKPDINKQILSYCYRVVQTPSLQRVFNSGLLTALCHNGNIKWGDHNYDDFNSHFNMINKQYSLLEQQYQDKQTAQETNEEENKVKEKE